MKIKGISAVESAVRIVFLHRKDLATFVMNKLLIVFLAVCLVSTHAFVKRDAPPPDNKNYLETIQKQIQEFGKSVNDQVSHAFDPDVVKKNFNEFVDGVSKTMNDMKAATQPKAT